LIRYESDIKIRILQEYFQTMLYRDLIERYEIRDASLLRMFIRLWSQCVTRSYSINKIANQLKSLGLTFDKNKLYEYVDHLDMIYYARSVSKFDHALVKQTLKKVYLMDT
jgi:uncharacterized protein